MTAVMTAVMSAEYQWREGTRHRVDARLVAEIVEQLAAGDPDGVCSPAALVREARPTGSPIHGLFEWDDGVAGHKWRVFQARQVIGAIVYASNVDRQFVHVTVSEGKEGYAPLAMVAGNAAYQASALAEAKRYLQGAKARYGWISELVAVWKAIDAS